MQITVTSLLKVMTAALGFVGTPYEFFIGGLEPIDSIVGQVKAVGDDQGDIRYALNLGQQAEGFFFV